MKINKFILIFCMISVLLASCKKNKNIDKGCPMFSIVPQQPYENPVWHPTRDIIGFNHKPIKEINYAYGYDCPMQASYTYEEDSIGFYLINTDGTNQRRVLPYYLQTPTWSHDGHWIAFSNGGQIYKMPFDGNNFDTTAIEQLTFEGNNFFPAWSPDDLRIAYDSNMDSENGGYNIWIMLKNGTNKEKVTNGRMASWKNNDTIIYIGLEYNIFETSLILSNEIQLTYNKIFKNYPQFNPVNNVIAYYSQGNIPEEIGIWLTEASQNSSEYLLVPEAVSFSWSSDGKYIVYQHRANNYRIDAEKGTLWIINIDTKEKKQLTHNQFNLIIN